MPEVKLRLGLDDATLGLMMLGHGAGAFAASPLVGLAIGRFGCRPVMLAAGLVACLILPALTLLPGLVAMAAALVLFGAMIATVDVAMNAQAVIVEQAAGGPMMSGFHGLFSCGGLVGSALMSLLLHEAATPLTATLVIAAAAALTLLSQAPGMLPRAAPPPASPRQLPHGRLALIGALCFISFMAEGAVLDWSAVLLRFDLGATAGLAGAGYAAFSLAMTVGRLSGDALQRRVAPATVLRLGAVLATGGFLLLTALPFVATALAGCALIGLGLANMVPALFSAAARTPGMTPGAAISAASALGYIGLLAGPGLIGVVANATSLPFALAGLGILVVSVAVAARTVAR